MGDRDRWIALAGAIAVHVVLFAVIGLGLTPREKPAVSAQLKPVIKANAVNEEQVMEPYRKRLEAEAAEKRRIAEEKRQAAEAKKRAEEARRQAAEKKRKAEEAARRKAEQKRIAELKRKQEAEKARLAEQQRQRKLEAERQAAEENKRKAELAERKRLEEQKRREAEESLKAQMAAEAKRLAQEQQRQHSARLSRLQAQYVADITNKVQSKWLRPTDSQGTLCSVLINQLVTGDIVGVKVTDCDGDVAFKRSVEAAVRKASPLPKPPEPELFQREIEFVFRPQR